MVILVACEESQRVTEAFRAKGHIAFSADILKPSGNKLEWHYMGNCLDLLKTPIEFYTMDGVLHLVEKWDMLIAFPPCTYLTKAGACNIPKHPERIQLGYEAKDFFMKLYSSNIEHICIENPIPQKRFNLPKPSMRYQPYEFGYPYTKFTYLWLKNLPPLMPTFCPEKRKYPSLCKVNESGIKDRSKNRCKTFENVAKAMAEQWSNL